jgi:hypothetical protein
MTDAVKKTQGGRIRGKIPKKIRGRIEGMITAGGALLMCCAFIAVTDGMSGFVQGGLSGGIAISVGAVVWEYFAQIDADKKAAYAAAEQPAGGSPA